MGGEEVKAFLEDLVVRGKGPGTNISTRGYPCEGNRLVPPFEKGGSKRGSKRLRVKV